MPEYTWTESDKDFLNSFLQSPTGVKLKEMFDAHQPVIRGETLEAKAMTATAFNQWQNDRNFIKTLTLISSETVAGNAALRKGIFLDLNDLNVR